ncbi:MAG: hypothetical protein JNJ83_23355 [Verrucomicrobiaceae bacterium]|nr:hypothetical protein [Verrucomicrobiaceae bacterium]
MPTATKASPSKGTPKTSGKRRDVGTVIDRFANEFMLKPSQRGFDAVGEFIKVRRGE